MIKVDIDTLCAHCGYFTVDTEVNNGYGCMHPAQEEKYEGDAVGYCFASSCPLGYFDDEDEDERTVVIAKELAEKLNLN